LEVRRIKTVLKQLCEARGWSQRDLATSAKGTGAYIAQLETGVQRNLTSNTLKKPAKALKVTVGELGEYEDKEACSIE